MFEFMFCAAIILWLIEAFLLYLMNLSLLGEVKFFNLIVNDYRVFLGFVISITLFFLFIVVGGLMGLLLSIALILGWPFFIYSLEQEERDLKSKRIMKNKEEIEWMERKLSDIGDDFGPLLRLGKLYEEIEDMEKALEYYKKATSKVKKVTLSDTERKIRQIEYFLKGEEKGKLFSCKKCGRNNYSTSLFCEKCNKMLHSSYLAYIRYYAPVSLKIGVIILIISVFLFGNYLNLWANLTFYFLVFIDFILFQRRMKR